MAVFRYRFERVLDVARRGAAEASRDLAESRSRLVDARAGAAAIADARQSVRSSIPVVARALVDLDGWSAAQTKRIAVARACVARREADVRARAASNATARRRVDGFERARARAYAAYACDEAVRDERECDEANVARQGRRSGANGEEP